MNLNFTKRKPSNLKSILFVFSFIIIAVFIQDVESHGRLMDPPSRNAMWRYGYATPTNWDDNQLWCGGAQNYFLNGEKCGICGDDWAQEHPRSHEAGGPFASGIVTRRFSPGQVIDAEIQITANHQGYFEFRLCPVKDEELEVTEECLNAHILEVLNGKKWDIKYTLTSQEMAKDFIVKVKLPYITCNRCVFQWTYTASNTWGTCANGTESVGCGPQETFKNCADIGIIMNSGSYPPGKQPIFITPPQNAILEPVKEGSNEESRKFLVVKSQVCVGTEEFKHVTGIDDWCQKNCLRYPQNCPPDQCKCLDGCHAIGAFKENEGANSYCQFNCLVYPPKNCTEDRCQCF